MEPTKRIIVNTAVQYVRSAVYMLLMLLTTRYILGALGHSDYGIYSVVGSTVFMLSFITVSLASSTQRFLSVAHGVDERGELSRVFANALSLHIALALLLALVMLALGPLFLGYLNIPASRMQAVHGVYWMVVAMVVLSFVTSPIRALYIARENIIYVSVVEMTDAVLKLLGALALPFIPYDSLLTYALMMCLVQVFNLFAYLLYAGIKYAECKFPHPSDISKQQIKQLTGFAVWNVYAVASTAARLQGIAIIINHFLGALINAAYGIALQMSNATGFIVLSILNSVNPQLMKAEGAGKRDRMLRLATKESKYAFLTLALLLIPLVVEMPAVLHFWLGTVPDYAVMFCRFVLVDYIVDQLTVGLSAANQAMGRIRNYTLLTCSLRFLCLPAAWLCLKLGFSPTWVMSVGLSLTIGMGLIRIPYLHSTAGLNIHGYVGEVVIGTLAPVVVITLTSMVIQHFVPAHAVRFILTEFLSIITGSAAVYLCSLTCDERVWIRQSLHLNAR